MDSADAGLIAEFVVESQEGLANIEQQMLAIETAGVDVDIDLVNAVFRTMHTIKGTAGFLGLDRIGSMLRFRQVAARRGRTLLPEPPPLHGLPGSP